MTSSQPHSPVKSSSGRCLLTGELSAPPGSKVKFPWCTACSSGRKSSAAAVFARSNVFFLGLNSPFAAKLQSMPQDFPSNRRKGALCPTDPPAHCRIWKPPRDLQLSHLDQRDNLRDTESVRQQVLRRLSNNTGFSKGLQGSSRKGSGKMHQRKGRKMADETP